MIGGYDLKYTKGPIHWHKADQEVSQWSMNLTQIKFGDDVLMAKPHPTGVFPDTGTSLNSLPSTVYWALVKMMQDKYNLLVQSTANQPLLYFPCTKD